MAFIIRAQHVQYDEVYMFPIQGVGTDKFQKSGQPSAKRRVLGAVFTGSIRVTKSERAGGYFILTLDKGCNADRRRVFFRGDALVRCGGDLMTLDAYWNVMVTVYGE